MPFPRLEVWREHWGMCSGGHDFDGNSDLIDNNDDSGSIWQDFKGPRKSSGGYFPLPGKKPPCHGDYYWFSWWSWSWSWSWGVLIDSSLTMVSPSGSWFFSSSLPLFIIFVKILPFKKILRSTKSYVHQCLKIPTCTIFLKSMGFKDIKYDIPTYQIWRSWRS